MLIIAIIIYAVPVFTLFFIAFTEARKSEISDLKATIEQLQAEHEQLQNALRVSDEHQLTLIQYLDRISVEARIERVEVNQN